ncbi:Rpn family recombination-promoting nuclease/putative transposase [Arsenophonus endosymbiont of Aleurodicus floccissimus]|uniref:Rpn family recombination-promoting nuclease/putative transposase n=1 Tax=Arsenophonus endosymbiont of Aleurodicus floccissimus TaxID=2152761 RepID=UPI002106676C|nr:Rpn family recombination-promoting nuclease/putative transposase [Arsenophonus endosymbiont of Aleurodicus floccissimus]
MNKALTPIARIGLTAFNDRELAESIYTQPFKLADVTTLEDDQIIQHRRMVLLTLIQKHIRRHDMTELMHEIVTLLSYNYYTDNQVITMFNYLIQESNAQKPMEFITEIDKQSEKHERTLMTIAQALRQEGLQKGKLEGYQLGKNDGVQEGKLEGKKQASMKIARQLLEKSVEKDIMKLSTGLTDTEMSNLFKD